jgi:hypothetical protein
MQDVMDNIHEAPGVLSMYVVTYSYAKLMHVSVLMVICLGTYNVWYLVLRQYNKNTNIKMILPSLHSYKLLKMKWL